MNKSKSKKIERVFALLILFLYTFSKEINKLFTKK